MASVGQQHNTVRCVNRQLFANMFVITGQSYVNIVFAACRAGPRVLDFPILHF